MKLFWRKIPEQITRILIVIVLFVASFFIARTLLTPDDFGEIGHFRSSAIQDIISQNIQYTGIEECGDCHDEILEMRNGGFHKNLSCEICHGPAIKHIEDEDYQLPAPRERGYCPLCHEYLPSRPTGFPQIIATRHNPMKSCINCHDPHSPEPPETIKECKACHAEIQSTKSISKHMDLECTKCHNTPSQHKITPRNFLPDKPSSRNFCGECHSEEADSEDDIPRIDLASHEPGYVCWQCHYPHLPETN